MLEMIETFLTTTSFFQILSELALLSGTDLVVLFLLSKPVFVIIALGAMVSGNARREAHYLTDGYH